MNYKTPGVYLEELSLLPPSVAQVETAIPAFIGYTEKAENKNGESLLNLPQRIGSMLDYRQYFGGPVAQPFTVVISDTAPFLPTTASLPDVVKPYRLYQTMELFFANGGGPCYIVSVGDYSAVTAAPSLDELDDYDELKAGLDAVRKIDEVTLLVIPEADRLAVDDYHTLCQDMLVQAGETQDRFAILDVRSDQNQTVDNFRSGIGTSYLAYGAAYYPYVETTLGFHTEASSITLSQAATSNLLNGLNLDQLEKFGQLNTEKPLLDALVIKGKAANLEPKKEAYLAVSAKSSTMLAIVTGLVENWKTLTAAAVIAATDPDAAAKDAAADAGITTLDGLTTQVNDAIAEDPNVKADIDDCLDAFQAAADDLIPLAQDAINGLVDKDDPGPVDFTVLAGLFSNQFNAAIQKLINTHKYTLPPSSALAGLYAHTDNNRGVWKAPANVSLRYVTAPAVKITHDDQRDLNVHSTGKSINAIRAFSGRGILVWGARTLAGNDNEWRYVPVRRFYNMVEESVKKASEAFVFENNNANTWTKVKAMIENYLTLLWRQGAMMGATTDDAYFVKIGLGETMTAQDVLEGRMIVEIGLATVRPAEFIILRFSHFMQEN